MKFNKSFSKSIITIALLGITFGGTFSLNTSANTHPAGYVATGGNDQGIGTTSNFKVNNGLLTLDHVPTLNFDNQNNNETNIINLSPSSNKNDDSGLLEVTDYRKEDSQNDNTWGLTANLQSLTPVDNNANSNKQQYNNKWEIDLFNQNNNLAHNLDNNSNNPNVNNTTLTNGNDTGNMDASENTDPTQNRVMYKNSGSTQGEGVNQINYNSSNAAQLITPNVKPGSYKATINWNLSTNPNEGSN